MGPLADSKLIFGVLAASLAGSFHCVAMCGGFASMAAVTSTRGRSGTLGYQAGRLLGYALIGAVAGALGRAVFAREVMEGLGFASGVVLGAFLVLLGFQMAVTHGEQTGLSRATNRLFGQALGGARSWAYPRAKALPPSLSGFGLGACSVLLPCGWLYSFVWVALATESPWQGGLVLFAFWFGTLPWMLTSGMIMEWVLRHVRAQRWMNKAVALLLVGVGMFSIAQKVEHFQTSKNIPVEPATELQCHTR